MLTAASPRAAPAASMRALLGKQRELLVASAFAGGLSRARGRSSPDRVAIEARAFVALVRKALGTNGTAALANDIRENVRIGAFAGAPPEQVAHVFAVWRRTLAACVAGSGGQAVVTRTLDRLERLVRSESTRWAKERIDVVVIGASAGGIPALRTILSDLGPELPATVLVVLHIHPNSPGLVPIVLSRATRLPIAHGVDRAALYLGFAYVAPPAHHLMLGDRQIRVDGGPPVHMSKPAIDVLFETASVSAGRHVLSVVLTGTGRDGADGSRAVHDRQGTTFAQDPASAEFSGMPQAAIDTGAIDRVIPLSRLGDAIRRRVHGGAPKNGHAGKVNHGRRI